MGESLRRRGRRAVAASLLLGMLVLLAPLPTPAGAIVGGGVQGTLTVTDPAIGLLWKMVLRPTFGGDAIYDDVEIDPTAGPAAFTLTGVPAGTYTLEALASSFGTYPIVLGQTTVVIGATMVTQNVVADTRPACVNVEVRKAGGVPELNLHTDIPGIGGINFIHLAASTSASVTTDYGCYSGGPFVMQALTPDFGAQLGATAALAIPGATITAVIDLDGGPPAAIEVSGNPYAQRYVDQQTGDTVVTFWRGSTQGLTLDVAAPCPTGSATAVKLWHGGSSFAASPSPGNPGTWRVALTRNQIAGGALQLDVTCPGPTTVNVSLGRIVLYDPSGIVTDAVTGLPVVGATVQLHEALGWMPRPPDGEMTCETNVSKPPATPWSQPAPLGDGAIPFGRATEGSISPAITEQLTDSVGHYGWDVPTGCWFVTVEAVGYEPLVSPMVGVPTAVTDLDLELTPLPTPPGSGFVPVTPFRALDSRDKADDWNGFPLGAGTPRSLKVGGADGIPEDAAAVVANVTVTGGTAASYLQAYPTGQPQPVTANLLFGPGQTVPNLVTVGLGTDGRINLFNQLGSVHIIVDVVGYYDRAGAGDGFLGMTPARVLDSREASSPWGDNPLGNNQARALKLGGAAGVPPEATAVVANVTATGGTAASFLQAYPTGEARPVTANLLFAPGQTVPNLVTVKLGTDGKVDLYNQQGTVDVIVDVVGWYQAGTGDLFHPITPVRVLDDRSGIGLTGAWGANQSRSFAVGGAFPSIPDIATGAVMNVTATEGSAASFLTVYPDGVAKPPTASLLFAANQTVPNLAIVQLGSATGKAAIYNQAGTVHIIADVAGYFAPVPA